MRGPLRVRERRARLFDEETPSIREFDNPSLVASEQGGGPVTHHVVYPHRGRSDEAARCPRTRGMVSSLLHVLIVTPVIFTWLRERELSRNETAPAA